MRTLELPENLHPKSSEPWKGRKRTFPTEERKCKVPKWEVTSCLLPATGWGQSAGWRHLRSLGFTLNLMGSPCSVLNWDLNIHSVFSIIIIKVSYTIKFYSFETRTVLLILTFTYNCVIITTVKIHNSSNTPRSCLSRSAGTPTPIESFCYHCVLPFQNTVYVESYLCLWVWLLSL